MSPAIEVPCASATTAATPPAGIRLSVALCTFNGARYLSRQLESIAAQTRLPDELVISDDHSTDETPAILERFAAEAPFPVRLFLNDHNVGSNRNFEQTIRRCAGDLIALCDQDDLWFANRLERSEQAFLANPQLGLLFSDGDIIDENDTFTGDRLWTAFRFNSEIRQRIRWGDCLPLLRTRFVTGATVVFRARLRDYCFPVAGEWVHDGWMAAIIGCIAPIDFIEEPLISYRRHAAQQVGTGPENSKWWNGIAKVIREHWLGIDWHRNSIEEVMAALGTVPPEQLQPAARDFARQRDFLRMRLTLPRLPWLRLRPMLPYLQEYQRRASGLLSIVIDIVLPKSHSELGAAAAVGFSVNRPDRTPPPNANGTATHT